MIVGVLRFICGLYKLRTITLIAHGLVEVVMKFLFLHLLQKEANAQKQAAPLPVIVVLCFPVWAQAPT